MSVIFSLALLISAGDSSLEAEQVAQTLGQMERDVRHALSRRGTSRDLYNALERYLDFPHLASYALDSQWPALSPKQQKKLSNLLRDVVALQVELRVRRPTEFEVSITRQQKAGEFYGVIGVLNPGDPDPTDLTVTLKERDGRWRVVDVAVDGSSMARNYRNEFVEVLSVDGLSALFRWLNTKKKELRAKQR
ncbi:MAG: ABC transporter substrate-binding protein [Myxococcota bacterium]